MHWSVTISDLTKCCRYWFTVAGRMCKIRTFYCCPWDILSLMNFLGNINQDILSISRHFILGHLDHQNFMQKRYVHCIYDKITISVLESTSQWSWIWVCFWMKHCLLIGWAYELPFNYIRLASCHRGNKIQDPFAEKGLTRWHTWWSFLLAWTFHVKQRHNISVFNVL